MVEPQYRCESCKDRGGHLGKKEDEDSGKSYDIWIECHCTKQRKIERLMSASEITEQFKSKGFTSFELNGKPQVIHDAFNCASSYYQAFTDIRHATANSIALLGNPGSGKTHLLTALSNNLMHKKLVQVLYFPYIEGFENLRQDFEALETKLDRMRKVEVLYIDDMFKPVRGKAQASEWELRQIFSIVNYRYSNNLPMIVSSELDIDKMTALDEGIATRLAEMCSDYTVVIEGDRRDLNHRIKNY